MSPLVLSVIGGLGLLLAVSAAGNWLLWSRLDAAQERATTAERSRDTWMGAANGCSAQTDAWVAAGKAAGKIAADAMQRADQAARAGAGRAQTILQVAPSSPGDPCLSADVLNRRMLEGAAK